MVGRDSELALLRAIVDRCESEGQPHLVTVYGEAGVGKSRLVRELVEWAEQQLKPPVVLRGRCLPYGDGVTYWPLAEILKGLAGVFDSDLAATVTAKLRALGDSLSLGDPDADVGSNGGWAGGHDGIHRARVRHSVTCRRGSSVPRSTPRGAGC